jgi:hypothetical protein
MSSGFWKAAMIFGAYFEQWLIASIAATVIVADLVR